ncbi:MAG: aldo/keto reductase [Robiginitomaculum sp.]|nr:MAG: aldo/keto reductase [Robiginitomaculum sp.]
MKSRILGKSGLNVSEIGLGCWQFGGDFGPIDSERALATLSAASAAGVTFFDTADVYGAGQSESFVGQHVASGIGEAVVATKVGRTDALYPDKYTYEGIRSHLLASAERIGVEQIDLIQLHCVPPAELERGAVFDILNRLQAEGVCRAWGASVETLAEAKVCLKQEGLTSLQIIFNLFRQDAAWELLPAAEAANVGVIVRLPLASGMLSGKFGKDTKFAETDHRNYNKDGAAFSVGETFSGIEFSKALELVEALQDFVPEGMSLVEFSLRWLLDFPAVSSVIAGCSRPQQVTDNVRASDLPPLSDEIHAALRAFYEGSVREHIRCPI